MLLENKSKLHFFAELDLKFEDDSTKKLTVNIGDTINISFKCNGIKIKKQGVVTNIYPSRIIESQLYGSKKLSAVLELDCSSQFKAFSYKVDINDILDIHPVEEIDQDGTGDGSDKPGCVDDDNVWNDLSELLDGDFKG